MGHPDQDIVRRGRGRPKGSLSKVSAEARAFARNILNSEAYRDSLEARIEAGTLPPRIEEMLYHYAYGKPSTVVELNLPNQPSQLSAMSKEELLDRAEGLLQLASKVALLPPPKSDESPEQTDEKDESPALLFPESETVS